MPGKILVIDDSPELLGFFSSVLQPQGYEVIPAADGEEGLTRFREELPDLVFLDMLLPRKPGSEVVADIKATDHGLVTPVVLMSGMSQGVSRVDLMRTLGVIDFLTKPIPVAKISHLAEWILGGRSDEEIVPAVDPELDRFELSPGAEGVLPIADAGLLLALRTAGERHLSGILAVARGRHRRALVLEEGRVVGARSNAPADRVDRILVAMRRTTPGQMSALRDQLFAPGADALSVLESLGVIDAAARETVLRYQAMTIALALFRWTEGSLRMVEGEAVAAARLDEPMPTARLLLLGLRKSREARERAAQPILREEGAVLRVVSEESRLLAACALTRRERDMFDLIDGKRTVNDLAELGRLAQMPAHDVLAVIAGAGLVEPVPPAGQTTTTLRAATVVVPSGEQLVGDLSTRPLVELVGYLWRAAATGILSIEGASRRQFAFAGGELVFARSSDASDRLGQMLLAEGRIEVDLLERALEFQREHQPNRRLGSILVDQGDLSIAALEQAVQVQILRILESSCAWTEGPWSFEATGRGLGASVRLNLGQLDLLRLGVNRIDLPHLRRRWLGGVGESFVAPAAVSAAGLALAAHELQLAEIASRRPSIEELVAGNGRDAVVLKAVELLVALGVIEVQERERSSAGSGATPSAATSAAASTVASGSAPERFAGSDEVTRDLGVPGSDPDADTETMDLPIVVLEAEPQSQALPAAEVDRVLGFLRLELTERRDRAERDARSLAEEVGRLRERVSQLEEDNARLRAAAAEGARAAAPPQPAPPAPKPAARPRSRRRKPDPEPVGAA